jgi:TPR repeat protein
LPDDKKALHYYYKAADLNNANAIFTIGTAFANGYHGLEEDVIKSREWFCRSASLGHQSGKQLCKRN